MARDLLSYRQPHAKPWDIGFRGAAKVAPGWTLTPHRATIRLQVRRAGQTAQGVVLPLDWQDLRARGQQAGNLEGSTGHHAQQERYDGPGG